MSGAAANAQTLARALKAIETLQARLAATHEPVAVIGLGCRLPGAEDPDAYWRLLRDGLDAVTDPPPDRWDADALCHPDPATPGRMYARQLGTVGDLREFDHAFFGIAPREAVSIDPQQRLVLEVAWEALEHAAIPPHSLAGTPAGVFMAACGTDYFQALLARGEEAIDPYFASGTVHSMMSGRLSYILGLTGPSLSVDTACSSSLVAVHLACQALRRGECDMALAGGVNRIILPTYSIAFSQSRMLSPDGRCKAFSSLADGYGRAEGCGVVVLRRLSDAVSRGERVLAVIRGSAVNQDGATSGLTVPNGPAQAAVIRAALRDGGVAASDVGLIEAHGTGTSLGDPIEMGALRDVFASGRDGSDPLWVGSVKTNIGHAEGAAGIAGLIKLVLSLRHRCIPAHLHLDPASGGGPSQLIDWAAGALAVPLSTRRFEPRDGRWIAGVSSFGFSGTNAHVVLEAAPEPKPEPEPEPGVSRPGLYVVSGRSEAALLAAVSRHADFLSASAASWPSLCHTSGAGRSHFAHRAAVVARSAAEAAHSLQAPGLGAPGLGAPGLGAPGLGAQGVRQGRLASGARPRLAFLFTGQGSVPAGMGLSLLSRNAAFASVIEASEPLLAGALRRPLREVLAGADDLLSRTDHAQPALYVVQCALLATWRDWGVEPALVLGHSVGEYAAAHAAGVFDFATGLGLVVQRGRLMQSLPAGGGMLSLGMAAAAAASLAADETLVSLAAENGPGASVLSGPVAALERVLRRLPASVPHHWLTLSHGFHSPLMAPVTAQFGAAFAGVALSPPRLGMVSTVSGSLAGAEPARPDYWVRQVQAPVRFASGMASLVASGATGFVEIGPRPVLLGLGRRCVDAHEHYAWAASLHTDAPDGASKNSEPTHCDEQHMLESLATLHLHGVPIAWHNLHRNTPPTQLPTYPWQKTRMWAAPEQKLPGTTALSGLQALRVAVNDAEAGTEAEHAREGEGAAAIRDFAELSSLYARLAALPPAAQQRAAAFLRRDRRADAVDSFYTRLTDLFAGLERHAEAHPDDDIFLTFAPFPAILPGFSWMMTSRFPEQRAEHFRLCLAAQRQMRTMLFRHVDFETCRSVLDLGCGNGSDVVALARRFPQMTLVGQTISRGQAAVARQKVERAGLADRVTIRHADSATTRSHLRHDLVLGFEVIHHIADKAGLFATIAAQLAPGGRLIAADFVASSGLAIDDDATMSGFLDAAGWAGGLARNGIAITDGIDISEAVANFLHDPALEENLGALGAEDDICGAFRGFVRLGELLRHGDVRYVLLDARQQDAPEDMLRAASAAALDRLVPYDDRAVSQWVYQRSWQPEPGREQRGHDADVRDIAAGAAALAADLLRDDAIEAGRRALPQLEALSDAYAASALSALRGDVLPRHEALAALMRSRARPGNPAALLAGLRATAPEAATELALVQRCGESLAAVLAGDADPLTLLFPDGDLGPLTHVYERAPVARAMNSVLAHVCSGLRSGDRFRVIEIGGGTGGSTSWVLDRLRGADVSYCFTDVSETFLSAARARFAAVSGFCARRLDIEQPPAAQGFAPGSFDLVIAANVVHATRDVRASLRHAVSLLAPGGCVVLLEGTSPRHWVDLTFGLTEGWWRFSDRDLRPSHPLLAAPAWEALLRECGLRTAMVPGGSGLLFDQALVVGRLQASGSAPEIADDWLLVSCGAETSLSGLVDPDDVVAALRRHAWAGVALLSFGTEVEAACRSVLRVMQDLSAHGFAGRVVLATRDAMAAAAADQVGSLAGAALWGLGAAAALEHPEWRLRRVDLPCAPEPVSEALWAELKCEDAEDQVAWRSGQRLVARLRHRSWPPELSCGMRYRGTWLITGGLGGLGLAVAGWLLERGVSDVVLVGRHLSEASLAAVQRLRTLVRAPGGSVVVRLADVRDRSALAAVVDEAGAALRGVVHAAGVLDDGVLGQLDWERFRAVLQPKVMGARNLHELTRDHALDAFVLFSSAASLLGNAGQASHAAANAYLDGLAQHRHAHALPALSINWGAWADIGSASGLSGSQDLGWSRRMTPGEALEAFAMTMQGDFAQAAVLPIDWRRVTRGAPFFSLLRRVAPAPGAHAAPAAAETPCLHGTLAQILGMDAAMLDPDRPLRDYGFDSLMAISLRNRIRADFDMDIPLATLMHRISMRELSDAMGHRGIAVVTTEPAHGPTASPVSDAEADDLLIDLLANQFLINKSAEKGG